MLPKKRLVTRLINPNDHPSLERKGTKVAFLSQLPHDSFVSEDVPSPLPKEVSEVKQKLLWNLAQEDKA